MPVFVDATAFHAQMRVAHDMMVQQLLAELDALNSCKHVDSVSVIDDEIVYTVKPTCPFIRIQKQIEKGESYGTEV